ncbi:CehA/McbA family metallohydrolase [Effusibacillus lacus]|uniref:Phosphoesterase n=1 Tax=Effusibacillus lacus TaxID=1348429 RepID=A0A292YNM1_9BACL|nr:CehA/McbA family metallohydrolase [Effusibacillus lacus]TCS69530.1 hypothetical protein EDD64_13647 [Effusibacillus lacus]GAX90060.1 phosphoesterase [Effusibacillus lacus]
MILTRTIHSGEQGSYIEVPFQLPEDTKELYVSYQVKSSGTDPCIVDLGVKDPMRVRGWSGGARTEFTIGMEKATPGYLSGHLVPGQWAVLLGAYKIPKGGCEVTLTLEFKGKQRSWLKGDLHVHSEHSDGTYSLWEKARRIEAIGLDFVALTDHNTVSQNFSYPKDSPVIFIPGMELTTNSGHCNLYGVEDPLQDFRVTSMEELHERIREAREKGAKISLNHPYCPNCGWKWDFSVDHDWVEVWNGPWRPSNQQTLNWWQEQLVSGRRLVAVGGSDTHGPHHSIKYGMPTNWVFSESRTSEGILDAIDRGHVFLSFSPEGPIIDLHCGSYMIGDMVESPTSDVRMTVTHLLQGDIVKIISNRGVEDEIVVDEDTGVCEKTWTAEDRYFYRVEVWRYLQEIENWLVAALSNPIYFRS